MLFRQEPILLFQTVLPQLKTSVSLKKSSKPMSFELRFQTEPFLEQASRIASEQNKSKTDE